ncbi:MAG: ATP-binding cassette domain-containing protein [Candidatus Woesearchaeota archaeon]|nr:MAG: ATP-binding cassette domain-containing protein [Candidatus Woesearchaeota archaeon]
MTAKPIIRIEKLVKDFKVPIENHKKGIFQSIKNIFYKKYESKTILKGFSFDIQEGEFVGFIGPNGAGKSTTIKMMTGILTPSAGTVEIMGSNPKEKRENYKHIGVVFGQRSLLEFDISVIESFKLYKDIYEVSDKDFRERIEYFGKILDIKTLLDLPVRKLSLGQRMRCEIAAALLHNPKIVYLDEPTIGLDVVAKENIRHFLKEVNEKFGTTIILTTHDMDDIEQTCQRIIIIDEGDIIYDGSLRGFNKEYLAYKTIELDYEHITDKQAFTKFLKEREILLEEKNKVHFKVFQDENKNTLIKKLLNMVEIKDIAIHQPRLESAIKEIYQKEK